RCLRAPRAWHTACRQSLPHAEQSVPRRRRRLQTGSHRDDAPAGQRQPHPRRPRARTPAHVPVALDPRAFDRRACVLGSHGPRAEETVSDERRLTHSDAAAATHVLADAAKTLSSLPLDALAGFIADLERFKTLAWLRLVRETT